VRFKALETRIEAMIFLYVAKVALTGWLGTSIHNQDTIWVISRNKATDHWWNLLA